MKGESESEIESAHGDLKVRVREREPICFNFKTLGQSHGMVVIVVIADVTVGYAPILEQSSNTVFYISRGTIFHPPTPMRSFCLPAAIMRKCSRKNQALTAEHLKHTKHNKCQDVIFDAQR